jgi:hypothetical protein
LEPVRAELDRIAELLIEICDNPELHSFHSRMVLDTLTNLDWIPEKYHEEISPIDVEEIIAVIFTLEVQEFSNAVQLLGKVEEQWEAEHYLSLIQGCSTCDQENTHLLLESISGYRLRREEDVEFTLELDLQLLKLIVAVMDRLKQNQIDSIVNSTVPSYAIYLLTENQFEFSPEEVYELLPTLFSYFEQSCQDDFWK